MNVALLETIITEIIARFQSDPFHFFSERELHAEFYAMCRTRFGSAKPKDIDVAVPLFRHEYNTIWRYRRSRRGDSFRGRSADDGVSGSLDFAILNRSFVESCELLSVINKDEKRRDGLRKEAASLPPRLDAAVEFKMAHVRDALFVRTGVANQLRLGVLEDCRKMAHETPEHAYMLVFTHAEDPSTENAAESAARVLRDGAGEFSPRCSGSLRLLLATPEITYLHGQWERPDAFAKMKVI